MVGGLLCADISVENGSCRRVGLVDEDIVNTAVRLVGWESRHGGIVQNSEMTRESFVEDGAGLSIQVSHKKEWFLPTGGFA